MEQKPIIDILKLNKTIFLIITYDLITKSILKIDYCFRYKQKVCMKITEHLNQFHSNFHQLNICWNHKDSEFLPWENVFINFFLRENGFIERQLLPPQPWPLSGNFIYSTHKNVSVPLTIKVRLAAKVTKLFFPQIKIEIFITPYVVIK